MRPPPPGISNPPVQANQPTQQPHNTPTGSPFSPSLLLTIMVGAHKISFPYGKYTCVS